MKIYKTLQIWVGDKFPEELLPYSAKGVHPGFTSIGSSNFLGADTFILADEYADMMQASFDRISESIKG